MAKRKKTKKQDETLVDIVEVKQTTQDFFEKNQNIVLGVLAAIIILVGGLVFYNTMIKGPREKNAMAAMFRAEEQFARDSFALALENPGGGFDGFLDIIDNYRGTKTANLANYYSGVSYLNLGRYDAAIEYLTDFKPAGKITPIMKNGALGDAFSELGDFEKALSFYKKATQPKNEFLTPYYLKKVGLLSEKLGDKSGALKAYTEIKENFFDSNEATDIEKYIARVS
ncbi:MAG TPA: tetratricopeptide repeat protein [Saprospiraceae bacterium]|nr:tetratricopeptide repeat protein [Saprospiraceae bacterium]